MIEIEWIVSFLLLGSVVGIIAGLLGVGGGGIMVPTLTFIFLQQGINVNDVMHLALGTSMASIIVTSISSLRAHHQLNNINWKLAKLMSIGVIIGTFSSTFIASHMNSPFLAIFFTVFMGYTAINMLFKKQSNKVSNSIDKKNLFISSTGIGTISALVSIGGGSLTVPYLTSKNIDIKKAIGTSAAIGLPISIAGTIGYLVNGVNINFDYNYSLGFIYLPAVFYISITSFITAPYGAKLAQKLPVNILKKLFALMLISLSIKMLLAVI